MKAQKFWQIWGNLEYTALKFQRLSVILAVALILETIVLLKLATQKKPIVVVPGAVSQMEIYPGEVPPEVVKSFGVYVLSLYASFTPQTYDEQVKRFLKFVHPEIYSELKSKIQQKAVEVKETQYSQAFYPIRVYVKKGGSAYTLQIEGILKRFLGGKLIGEEKDVWEITLEKIVASKENPLGLVVSSIVLNPQS